MLKSLKDALLSPEGFDLFIKEASKLLFQKRKDAPNLQHQLEAVSKEIQNIMTAIKAGILTETTEKELRNAESKKKELEVQLKGENEESKKLKSAFPKARERFQYLVHNIEKLASSQLELIREQIKTLVGGEIRLHPTNQGFLEAEVCGDYASFLKLSPEQSKIIVVAGEGFEPSTFGL